MLTFAVHYKTPTGSNGVAIINANTPGEARELFQAQQNNSTGALPPRVTKVKAVKQGRQHASK